MKTNPLRQTIRRKALLLLVPLLLLAGFAIPGAQAQDDHRGRHRDRRDNVVRRHDGRGYDRREYRGGRRHHRGYYRSYHGRRYWYEGGRYYSRPGGISINIGL